MSEYDEIWHVDVNFDQGDGNMRKFQKFSSSRWRTDAILNLLYADANFNQGDGNMKKFRNS